MNKDLKDILMIALSSLIIAMALFCLSFHMNYQKEAEAAVVVESVPESDPVTLEPVIPEIIEEEKTVVVNEVQEAIQYEPIQQVFYTPSKYLILWNGQEISEDDYKLLLTTVYCESGNQSFNCQYMTALCILNRVCSPLFPNTVREVAYQKNQFEVTHWKDFENYGWTQQVLQAVTKAMTVNEHPDDMYYFRTHFYFKWAEAYKHDGVVYFSRQKEN